MNQKLCIGEISNVHGIKGHVIVRAFVENTDLLRLDGMVSDKKGLRIFTFTQFKPYKDNFMALVEGVEDRTGAEALKGTKLYIDRDHLPDAAEDEIYHIDLVGKRIVCKGQDIGEIEAVQNFGASDLLDIKRPKAKNFYLPYSPDTILEVRDDAVIVDIPNGLLELYE